MENEPIAPEAQPDTQLGNLQMAPMPTQKRKWRQRKFIIPTALFLPMAAALLLWVFVWDRNPKPSQTSTARISGNSICYVRLAHLDCLNTGGTDETRYDLPKIAGNDIGNLALSPDSTKFLTWGVTANGIWLLDNKLKTSEQVNLNTNLDVSYPSWSRGSKSILLEGDGSDNDRQIYRYTFSTQKLDKLTDSGFNSTPYETKDGHILYGYFDGKTSWYPYLMAADGSNKQLAGNFGQLIDILGFSYDANYDTIFVYGTIHGTNGASSEVAYETITDMLAGKAPQTVRAQISSSGDWVGYVDSSKILVADSGAGTILDLKTGKTIATISHFSEPVGILSNSLLASLTKSAQQKEQPYERISNLSSAPADFQTFIKGAFTKQDAQCTSSGGPPGIEENFTINAVVRDGYASVVEGCGEGAVYYYVKANDAWTQVAATQMSLDCTIVNQYKIPS